MKYPWQLYHWHFEISGKCTLACPRCPRNDAQPVPWLNQELDLDFFQRTLTPDLLRNHVQRITFCGDIGDPIYASQFLEVIDYVKSVNPLIHTFTITNGSYKKNAWWHDFAKLVNDRDTVNFSVDGFDAASNSLYRVRSDWSSIMSGINIMAQHSPAFVNWATIVFAFNQDHLDIIQQKAQEAGCDGLQITLSTKFGSKYGAAYGGESDILEPRSEFISATHRYERKYIPLTNRHINNQAYMEINRQQFLTVQQQHRQFVTPLCQIGNRGLYVSADGILHPCSWVSFPYQSLSTNRKVIEFKNSFHQMYRPALNLKQRTLKDVLDDPCWSRLFESVDNQERAWVECEQKCHKDLITEDYAVQWLTN